MDGEVWHAAVHGVAQSYLTLCDPVDCSSPGSSVNGILQARMLEWVAISFFFLGILPLISPWTQWYHMTFPQESMQNKLLILIIRSREEMEIIVFINQQYLLHSLNFLYSQCIVYINHYERAKVKVSQSCLTLCDPMDI